MNIEFKDLGLLEYTKAWVLQDELRAKREKGDVSDLVLFVEHPPVFTMGRRDCESDFISSSEEIAADGIEIVKTNRGGRVTYHGPGQLVAYFIFELGACGVKDFVFTIEEACIATCRDFGVEAVRDGNYPGVWFGGSKIAAVGLNVSHGITQHGIAINVDCDLRAYRHITACGIRGRGVANLTDVARIKPSIARVKESFSGHIVKAMQTIT